MSFSRTFSTPGVILKRRNLNEADRLLTIYTKRFGKLNALAKGVRKLTSRKKGSIELFTHAKLFFAQGKNLDLLTESEAINTFPKLRRHLSKTTAAYQVIEALDRLTREGQDHPGVFDLLLATLERLSHDGDDQAIITHFETKLLEFLGFGLPSVITPASLTSHIESIIDRHLNAAAQFGSVQ